MKSVRKTEIMQNFFDYMVRRGDFNYEDFKAQFDLTDTEIDMCAGCCLEDDDDDADNVVVYVKDGMVQEVKSSNPNMEAYICDYDTIHDERSASTEAEEIGNEPGMYSIY